MERKGKAVPVGSLVEKFFRGLGQEQRLRESRVFEVWDEAVGADIARNARPVSVKDGLLVVEVRNPVWMTELTFARPKLKSKLNRALGRGAIRDISFRIGEFRPE